MSEEIKVNGSTLTLENKQDIDIQNKNFEYLNYLPSPVLIQVDGKIIYANDKLKTLLRCNEEYVLEKSIESLVQLKSNESIDNTNNELFIVVDGEYKIKDFHSNIIEVEVKYNSKQIGSRWYEFFVLRDITNASPAVAKGQDNAVTETRAASENRGLLEKLYSSKELYKKLIDLLPDGICIHDGNTYSFASDSYARMLGYDNPKELVGKRLEEVISKENHELMKQRVKLLLSKDEMPPRVEYRFITKQGIAKDFESTSVRFWHNNKLNILSTIRDITDKKRIEENRLLLERAKEYDKLKTEFFSNMSHELRTPLNILLSSLQLIKMYTDTEGNTNLLSISKYTGIMKQNCYRLLRLINNLLDITKIDSGFYSLIMCNQDIVKIVEDITLSVAEYVKEKGIDIIFDTDIEEKIIGFDADKIERVILNLLSNAVKFTKTGGKIAVNIHDLKDCVKITVRDTGSGIPKDKLNSIFDRFIQVDKSLSRRSEGTGIGLALVRSLVELHGGCITVESEYGEYTQFDIMLPAKALAAEDESSLCHTSINNDLDGKKVERMSIEFSDIYL